MKFNWITAIVMSTLVAACTSTAKNGTEVTRYHPDPLVPLQTFAVEFASPDDVRGPRPGDYTEIVAAELTRIGFTRTEPDDAMLLAVIEVRKYTQDKPASRSPFSIGIGGGSYGGNVGVGVGTTIPVGGKDSGLVNVTELEVNLMQRSDKSTVWQGRAVRTLEPGIVDQAALAQTLTTALFKDFPGESGRTETVN